MASFFKKKAAAEGEEAAAPTGGAKDAAAAGGATETKEEKPAGGKGSNLHNGLEGILDDVSDGPLNAAPDDDELQHSAEVLALHRFLQADDSHNVEVEYTQLRNWKFSISNITFTNDSDSTASIFLCFVVVDHAKNKMPLLNW